MSKRIKNLQSQLNFYKEVLPTLENKEDIEECRYFINSLKRAIEEERRYM